MNVMETVLRKKIDPYLSLENLSAIASEALRKNVRAGSKKTLLGGCWNRVIGVTLEGGFPDLVFKIGAETGDTRIAREFKVLEYFASRTGFPVPHPYLLESSGRIIPGTVLVMEKTRGDVLHQIYHNLTPGMRNSISEQIAHLVGKLHERTSLGFGGVECDTSELITSWSDFWLPRFDRVLEEVKESGLLDTLFLSEIESARDLFAGFLNIGQKSTLLHYDVWSGNIMIGFNKNEPAVTGFVDVQGYWGDYARELSFMELFGTADPRFYEIYPWNQAADEGLEIRKSIYNLKMNLKHITMYPAEQYYRRGARNCLRTILSA